ncbi:MAG: translation elongation factor Ts, partial [Akkermansiaceae bacterium]|nr:translation elongation factor Ts [Armatimonadota bacterium]
MAVITAALVNELRQKTGLGMMQCKKALTEAEGNLKEAEVVLRKTLGDKQLSKGAERTASEGSIFARVSDNKRIGAIIELNSETDFVARNDQFKSIGKTLVEKVLSYAAGTVPTDLEALLNDTHEGTTVGAFVNDAATTIGEKVALSRFERFGAPEGNVVSAYVHNPSGSGDEGGKIGVLVEVSGGEDTDALSTLAREIALHVSSSNPMVLSEEDVPADVIAKEREIFAAQAANDPKMAGKPEAAINAMVNGRVRVFLEESVLLKQSYVRDPAITIADLVKKTPGASVVRFV